MSTGHYLLDNPNDNSRWRGDGFYWGWPTRQGVDVTRVVIHTAEIEPDFRPPDLTAQLVAKYFTISNTPASYHEIGDTDDVVKLLPYTHTAFGAVGHNNAGWQWSFATRAALWGDMPDREVDRYLTLAAPRVAAALDHFDIPTRRLSDRDAQDLSKRGIIGHYQADPGRRTDPGRGFPWDRFLTMIDERRSSTVDPELEQYVREMKSATDEVESNAGFPKFLVPWYRTARNVSDARVRQLEAELAALRQVVADLEVKSGVTIDDVRTVARQEIAGSSVRPSE